MILLGAARTESSVILQNSTAATTRPMAVWRRHGEVRKGLSILKT